MKRSRVINRPATLHPMFPSATQASGAGAEPVGNEVRLIGKAQGESIQGNNKWYLNEQRDFLWSGNIGGFDDSELPDFGKDLKMTFTCDDYGVIDTIDDGIYDLAANDKIDSVECFVNGPDRKERIKRLFELKKQGKALDLGIHLTITSGRPLSALGASNGFVGVDGRFIDWADYNQQKFDNGVDWLGGEIQAQIDEAKRIESELCAELGIEGPVFTHLSSHHNALTFYESGFLKFLEIASASQYGVRTPMVEPKLKSILAVKVKVNLGALSGRSLSKLITEFNQTADWKVPYTDYLDMRHYGPLASDVLQKRFDKWVEEKQENKEKILSALIKSGKQHVEVVLHVRKGDVSQLAKKKKDRDDVRAVFQQELSNQGRNEEYNGVNIGYFDGRVLEYWAMRHAFDRAEFGNRVFLNKPVEYCPYP